MCASFIRGFSDTTLALTPFTCANCLVLFVWSGEPICLLAVLVMTSAIALRVLFHDLDRSGR